MASTSLQDIAAALGGRRTQRLPDGGYLVPCPVVSHGQGRGDRNPSLSLRDGDSRLLIRCYAGCSPLDVLDALRGRGLLDDDREPDHERVPRPPRPREPDGRAEQHAAGQHHKAARMWASSRPAAGTIVERYLREARGYAGYLPATLGFLPPAKPEHHSAMIGAFAMPDEPEPSVLREPCRVSSVHLTLLKPDGSGKADTTPSKLIVGSPRGLPIVLAPPNDLLGLAITEGVEDAVSVHQATGLGAWAAGSATFMAALADVVPDYIECVTIYAHGDPAGQNGACKLAEALARRGAGSKFLLRASGATDEAGRQRHVARGRRRRCSRPARSREEVSGEW